MQDAREEGQEALAAAMHERWLAAQARTWTSLEEDLQALARQLDDLSSEEGGQGHVRIRLWERAGTLARSGTPRWRPWKK